MNLHAWRGFVSTLFSTAAVGLGTLPVHASMTPGHGSQPADGEADPRLTCLLRARALASACHAYAQEHQDRLPDDLYGAFETLVLSNKSQGAERVGLARSSLLSPAHAGLVNVPDQVTPEWVNGGSSFVYLGFGDVSLDDVPDSGSTVVLHQRLEIGHVVEVSEQNPEGETFSVAFLDGHCEMLSRADAERVIAASIQTLDAIRKGTDLPEEQQAMHDLRLIMRAIRAYAAAHDDALPPDFGATLKYVPADARRCKTPAQRARIYLLPRVQKNTFVPDEPTAEWVNEHASYVYLGASDAAAIGLHAIPELHTLVLVHGRMDQGFSSTGLDGQVQVRIPMAMVDGGAATRPKKYAEWIARESRSTVAALREGTPLPDWVDAARDMKLIGAALIAYTKGHEDRLPPDLGETVDYLHVASLLPGTDAMLIPSNGIAGVYLSPSAMRRVEDPAPEVVTSDWVRQNGSYLYIMEAAGVRMTAAHEMGLALLAHGKVDEPYTIMLGNGVEMQAIPFAAASGVSGLAPREWFARELGEMKAKLRASPK